MSAESDGQRWLALEITVTNAAQHAVVLDYPGHPEKPPIFGFDIRGPLGGLITSEIAFDSSTLYFAPLATKTWRYEFLVAPDLSYTHVPVGQHFIRGGYANAWAAWDTVDVRP
ncbi:MAG TPA: hypothetical protein VFT29_16040 [Gemmatimonadaceae bacterium]|nr:hypothetical protein [Gemmatimonadaceae bacterium]